ncbi:HepT-like ribonuclease domain-containing protein [Brachyspira murdochii]|uniref:HepT-like ribonuclease domain-containing protein n=1 Tax=Brachyspira murdochii TaxID=84378 RepID=UPI0012F4F83F|nr:HepT-like ribonuclease domain-containing protein [Brachyspira murdochii]
MKKSDIYFINDIKNAISSIEEYLLEIKCKENFISNKRMQKLMMYEILIIGEASNKISIETKNNNPQIEWRLLSDMRNFLIHQYYDVCNDIIWETVKKDIPKLRDDINNIKIQ